MAADLKYAVKRIVMTIAALWGRIWPGSAESVRILTFHSIGFRNHGTNVKPDLFEKQMEWLAEHGNVISLEKAAQGVPGVAITFDDGYLDNLIYAAPVLDRLGLPATLFIVAGRMGGHLDHDPIVPEAALLTWQDVRELEDRGFTIGAHSLTHRQLSSLDESEQRQEILGSARALAARLGHRIEAFAYPFGSFADYTPLTQDLVKEAGFIFAVSNRFGVNIPGKADRWALRRIWVDAADDLKSFKWKVDGRLDVLCLLDSRLGLLFRHGLNRLFKRLHLA